MTGIVSPASLKNMLCVLGICSPLFRKFANLAKNARLTQRRRFFVAAWRLAVPLQAV
jgi:hypothetical protein